jgi:hypothetical protein
VTELSTRVVTADGQAIALGGLNSEKRDVYRRLFGVGKVFDGRQFGITLRATVMDVKPRVAPPPPK